MQRHHVVLNGVMSNGMPANTMQAKLVTAFVNDKGSVVVRKQHGQSQCTLSVKTAKGEYTLHSTNRENTAFAGSLNGIEARANVKKVVAHLYYYT